jgi:predicted GH43/DUF377 family glycosyl hydrolase
MMNQGPLSVRRLPERLKCDPSRTILRFFWPGNELRARKIIHRVMDMDNASVERCLRQLRREFSPNHYDFEETLEAHFFEATHQSQPSAVPLSHDHVLLIGAYFTMEYAHESAALFNPSMVPDRDQTNLEPGCMRFLMSLRAVGEGHLSSIVFRRGIIDPEGHVTIDPTSAQTRRVKAVTTGRHDKHTFRLKMIEIGFYDPFVDDVLDTLGDEFTTLDMEAAIAAIQGQQAAPDQIKDGVAEDMIWLAQANYELQFDSGEGLAELVIFPVTENESQGMEDMRLVHFTDDDGSTRYYGTYTAFNGHQILPQLIESTAAGQAHVQTLSGKYAKNKGMALFPRKIDGFYAMIGRMDGENLYYLQSDNVRFWNEATLIQEPEYPWQFALIGNCGPPIETHAGWLLLTHGVGPMRRYCMGASLLDLDDPTKVISQLDQPLLVPQVDERAGYVPNVVYSCGGLVHNGQLVIPYGISDAATGFAVVELAELLDHLQPN